MAKTPLEHPSKQEHLCEICDTVIRGTKFHFKCHLYTHDAIPSRYTCEYCSKEYFRRDQYTHHVKIHKEAKSRKRFICNNCGRGYTEKRCLISHLEQHGGVIPKIKSRFLCNGCGADFCEKRILMNHIRRSHFNLVSLDEPAHMKRTVNDSWYENVVKTNIRVQMTKVKSNIIVIKKCGKTEKKDVDSKKVEGYILASSGYTHYSKAVCDYCKKEMLKKSIEKHIKERHLKIRKFKCKVCSRTFKRQYQMSRHNCGAVRRRRTQDELQLAAAKAAALKKEINDKKKIKKGSATCNPSLSS